MHLSNGLEAPQEGEWGYTIKRDHLRDIAAAGFDTIRLPIKASGHLQGGKIDPAFLARVDKVTDWASTAGLTVILVCITMTNEQRSGAPPRSLFITGAGNWSALEGLTDLPAPTEFKGRTRNAHRCRRQGRCLVPLGIDRRFQDL